MITIENGLTAGNSQPVKTLSERTHNFTASSSRRKGAAAGTDRGFGPDHHSSQLPVHGDIGESGGNAMEALPPSLELAVTTTTEPRVDTRLLAQGFGNKHRHSLRLVEHYLVRFQKLGKVCFKNAPLPGSKTGQSERFALLNEDQAHLLLSLSRNSAAVVDLKVKLVQAFGNARRAADLRKAEYLPGYHDLHDRIGTLAAGSTSDRFVHMNANKLLNKFAGIDAGQRAHAALPRQALLIVGQMVAAKATEGATDHHDGYQRIKSSLQALHAATMLEVSQ